MTRLRATLFVLVLLGLGWAAPAAIVTIPPGDSGHCSTSLVNVTAQDATCNPDTIAGVPVCTDQDTTTWHELVRRNADGSITCTYGHMHGDNPHDVDAVFGPPGAWWNNGQEQDIAYPWVTSVYENQPSPPYGVGKHNLFKWLVRHDLQPVSQGGGGNGWFWKNFRATVHLLGSGGYIPGAAVKDGIQVQVHSFQLEVQACKLADPNDCGTLRMGGSQDHGAGFVENAHGSHVCIIPNPLQPTGNPAGCGEPQGQRLHGDASDPTNSRSDFTWYNANSGPGRTHAPNQFNVNVGTVGEAWASVDPNNLDALPFIPPAQINGAWHFFDDSTLQAEVFGTYIPPLQGTVNGRLTKSGFTDPWGNPQPTGCTVPTTECVPYILTNFPIGPTLYRDSVYGATTHAGVVVDHDVIVDFPPATSSGGKASLIRYPN